MPISDFSHIDTTPGQGNAFSPPADFAGGEDEYAGWLQKQFEKDLRARQHMAMLSRILYGSSLTSDPVLLGPYAGRLRRACKALDTYVRQKSKTARGN